MTLNTDELYIAISKICSTWLKIWSENEEFNLKLTQMLLLDFLSSRKGRCKASDFVKEYHISPGAVTGITDKLEKSGFIERTPSSKDRRIKDLKITISGVELLRKSKIEKKKLIEYVLDGYNEPELLAIDTRVKEINQKLEKFVGGNK